MNLLLVGFIQAVLSGGILVFLKHSVEKSSANSVRASEAEKRIVQKEMSDMTVKFISMEQKHDKLYEEIHKLREKVSVLIQRSDDLQTRVFELAHAFETFKNHENNHGKVIRK